MKFSDLSKECPNSWEDFWKYYINRFPDSTKQYLIRHGSTYLIEQCQLDQLVGYLLKFFSSKGIEITRDINFDEDGVHVIDYGVWKVWEGEFDDADTLEQAICHAFKIIKGREK